MKENITILKRNFYTYKIIVSGFILAIFYIIVEAILDSYIFRRRERLLQDIFAPDLHEIFMRLIVVCLILLISLISQKLITEQIKTEQKLRESEEKYRHLFENSPFSIMIYDSNETIKDCNLTTEKLFGYKKTNLIGRNYIEFLANNSELTSILKDRKDILIKEKVLNPLEFQIVKNDDSLIWVNVQPLLFKLENELFLFDIIQDITERKKVEDLIKEELEKLSELNKIKKSLITRISHELKTPLNAIHSASHVLLNYYKEDMNETTLEYNEIIYKGTLRLKKLIEDLIDISRLEKYKLEINKKRENISNIIRDCALEITYLAKNRNLSLNLNIPENIFLEVDRIRIEQVLNNILSNAIKNTPSGGKISIDLHEYEENIDIYIRDSGVGFTEKEKGYLFKRFGKIERREEQLGVDPEGSGLGLFISKEIAELHGGQILVESEGRNKGSTFTIRLYKHH